MKKTLSTKDIVNNRFSRPPRNSDVPEMPQKAPQPNEHPSLERRRTQQEVGGVPNYQRPTLSH